MKKWTFAILLLCIGVAVAAWQLKWFESKSSAITDYVPADTILYYGGENTQAIADFLHDFQFNTLTSSDKQALDTVIEQFTGGVEDAPSLRFFKSFLAKYLSGSGVAYGQMLEQAGMSMSGSYALYLHGIAPVITGTISDAATFDNYINELATESDWIAVETTESIDQQSLTIKAFPFESKKDDVALDLIIAHNEEKFVITFFSSKDDEATKFERLGLVKPAVSLSDTGELTTMQTLYAYDGYFEGFFHIQRLAQAFLSDKKSTLKSNLESYLPTTELDNLNNSITQDCKTDFQAIADKFPRIVFGSQAIDIVDDSLEMKLHSLLEINDTNITGELVKLRGHIPNHVLNESEKLISYGVGFDSSNLVSVLTSFWTQFTQADFTCEQLVTAQQAVSQQNPAMLQMAMGMLQGVKGLGLSLFDVEFGDTVEQMETIDFLVSLAAEEPATIASMAQMIPQLGGLAIPTDGSELELPLPIPGSVSVKVAVKGNHIAVYSGAQGAKQAELLKTEELTANGALGFGFDYSKFGDVFALIPNQGGDSQFCIMQQEYISVFENLNMQVMLTQDYVPSGVQLMVDSNFKKPIPRGELALPGTYELSYMNEACQWESYGSEIINQDGTGSYNEVDPQSQCELFKTEYTWQLNASTLLMSPTSESSRESCDEEFETPDNLEDYSCTIINQNELGFQCIFDAGTKDATLFRYTRQ